MFLLISYAVLVVIWIILFLIAKWIPIFIFNIAISITFIFIIWRIVDRLNGEIGREQYIKQQYKERYNQEASEHNKFKELYEKSQNENLMLKAKLKANNATLENTTAENKKLQDKIQSVRCILCGEASNGKHFCYNCYQKHKNNGLDIRFKSISEQAEILDPYGNKTFICDDYNMVRSRAEALISNFLYNHKIRYVYEKPIYYADNKTLHPDFYLPDYDIYIEYNELDTESYIQSKEFAMRIYKQKNLKVYVMTNKDLNNIEAFIMPKLK